MKAHSLNPQLLHMFGGTYIVTTCMDSGFFISAKWDSSGFDPFFLTALTPFFLVGQLTLLGYAYEQERLVLELLALGSHENFYRDAKQP